MKGRWARLQVVFIIVALVIVIFVYNVPVYRCFPLYTGHAATEVGYDNIIFPYDGVTDDAFGAYCRQWDRVPKAVRDSFQNDGWDIVVCGNELYDGRVYGMTVFREHRLYLDALDGRIDSMGEGTLLHELGHYLHCRRLVSWLNVLRSYDAMRTEGHDMAMLCDYIESYKYLSGDPLDMYDSAVNWQDMLCMSDSSEYIAEAFKAYVILPSELQRLCPKTYKIIDAEVTDLIA